MRVQNRLFLTLPSRMTEEVSLVSWRRWGLEGASLGTILVWADQRTSLVQDRRLPPALEFTSLLPRTPLRPRSCTGPPCRAGPGAQERPEALPSSLSFPPLYSPPLPLSPLVLFSLSLVNEENFPVALDTVDTNARVRGRDGLMGRSCHRSSS